MLYGSGNNKSFTKTEDKFQDYCYYMLIIEFKTESSYKA